MKLHPWHRAILHALTQTPTLPIEDPEHLRPLLPAHAARWAIPSMLAYLQRAGLTAQLANDSWTLSPNLAWRLEDRRQAARLILQEPPP